MGQNYSGWSCIDSGNDTQDKIFLLSYAEVNKYLGYNNLTPRVAPTAYAISQGAWTSEDLMEEYITIEGEITGRWWLRSPGGRLNEASVIRYDGRLIDSWVTWDDNCVRPALWVNVGVISGTTVIEPIATPTETPAESYNTNTSEFAVGSYVTFGTYPMTEEGDVMNIVWEVLDRDGEKALLLSHYGLDAQPYNKEATEITWEDCTLRAWLNDDFLNRAFTAEEQSAILLTDVDNSNAQCYSKWTTSGGNNTHDKVFLLSYAEANEYLGVTYGYWNNKKAFAAPTAYTVAQGVMISDEPEEYYVTEDGLIAGQWWLRSPGHSQDYAICVLNSGDPISGTYVSSGHICVRPAMWVDVKYLQ